MSMLIVGAGPVGLCSAIALKLWGCDVRIVDQRDNIPPTSRALGTQARTMEILDSLGVARILERRCIRIGASAVYNEHRLVGRFDWHPPDSPFPYTYVASQSILDRLLLERATQLGVDVQWRTKCTSVESEIDGVTARFDDGSESRQDWVIGADGAHSTIRQAAGVEFEGSGTGQAFFLADVTLQEPLSAHTSVTVLGPEGPLMAMRRSDDPHEWRLFVDVTDTAGPDDDENQFDPGPLLDSRGAKLGKICITNVEWRSLYRVQVRHAQSYRKGRIFLAGDAAHVFPPFGGQGMNTGILDASNLCWKLALVEGGLADGRLLDTYHTERCAIGAQVIDEVEQRRKSFALRNPLARFARDAAFWLITHSQFLERQANRQVSQLDQHYRGRSWLSEQADSGRRARAGERAPDGTWEGRRLHEMFSATAFTLLVFDTKSLPPLDRQGLPITTILLDDDSHEQMTLRRAYAATGGSLILVRPDGYIGFRGGSGDLGRLNRYLSEIRRPQT